MTDDEPTINVNFEIIDAAMTTLKEQLPADQFDSFTEQLVELVTIAKDSHQKVGDVEKRVRSLAEALGLTGDTDELPLLPLLHICIEVTERTLGRDRTPRWRVTAEQRSEVPDDAPEHIQRAVAEAEADDYEVRTLAFNIEEIPRTKH